VIILVPSLNFSHLLWLIPRDDPEAAESLVPGILIIFGQCQGTEDSTANPKPDQLIFWPFLFSIFLLVDFHPIKNSGTWTVFSLSFREAALNICI
jgi:hypothetical protein